MAFGPIRDLIKRAKRLNENVLIDRIIRQPAFKELIIRLNTEEQLFKKGINALGIKLSDIGGEYSDVTLFLHPEKVRDIITLKDKGDFYASWEVTVSGGDIDIDADPIKESPGREPTNLFAEWGDEIVGLTEENLQIVIDRLRNELQREILKALRG